MSPVPPDLLIGPGEVTVTAEYTSLTPAESNGESWLLPANAPNILRDLNHEGTPTFHELVLSLLNEGSLGYVEAREVEGGYV